jgi:hypothetical protein
MKVTVTIEQPGRRGTWTAGEGERGYSGHVDMLPLFGDVIERLFGELLPDRDDEDEELDEDARRQYNRDNQGADNG